MSNLSHLFWHYVLNFGVCRSPAGHKGTVSEAGVRRDMCTVPWRKSRQVRPPPLFFAEYQNICDICVTIVWWGCVQRGRATRFVIPTGTRLSFPLGSNPTVKNDPKLCSCLDRLLCRGLGRCETASCISVWTLTAVCNVKHGNGHVVMWGLAAWGMSPSFQRNIVLTATKLRVACAMVQWRGRYSPNSGLE